MMMHGDDGDASFSSSASTTSEASATAKKPCGKFGPLGRRGGPFFFEQQADASSLSSSSSAPLVTMVVVGAGSPDEADAATFPLALPNERSDGDGDESNNNKQQASSSLLDAALSQLLPPSDVVSSLIRAIDTFALSSSSPASRGGEPLGMGSDGPLAEKKDENGDGTADDEEGDDDGEEGEEEEQEAIQEEERSDDENDVPVSEAAWFASFAAENAGENDRARLDDELYSSSTSASRKGFKSLPRSSAASFVDDGNLGMFPGFALLCFASGAAFVATVAAAKRAMRRREQQQNDSNKRGFEGGGEGIRNPLLGVVSAADFVDGEDDE